MQTLGCEQEGEDLTRHVEGSELNVCAGVVDFESPYLGRGATFAKRCALEDGSGCQLVWVLLVVDPRDPTTANEDQGTENSSQSGSTSGSI